MAKKEEKHQGSASRCNGYWEASHCALFLVMASSSAMWQWQTVSCSNAEVAIAMFTICWWIRIQ